MRRILAIQFLHMKEFFKTPSAWVLMFVMPILFSSIFGNVAVSSETKKPVVNIVQSNDDISVQASRLLQKNKQFKWEKVSEKQAKVNVLKQKVIAAVTIPENLSERITEKKPIFDIIVQRKSDQYLALAPFLEGIARVVYSASGEFANSDDQATAKLLKVVAANGGVKIEKQVIQKNDEGKGVVNLMFVGFAIMFMMFGLSGASSTILDEKKGGTWSRLLITPASKLQITLGYLGSYFWMGWLQFAVLMLAMKLLFDTSWGNLAYLIPFASLVILCVVGFGLMISGLVKTKQQAIALSAILITSTCMLGGVYWSLDLVPAFMKKISWFVPQSWAMSGFEEIISGSLHTQTLLLDTGILIGFTVIFFAIGLRLMKYE